MCTTYIRCSSCVQHKELTMRIFPMPLSGEKENGKKVYRKKGLVNRQFFPRPILSWNSSWEFRFCHMEAQPHFRFFLYFYYPQAQAKIPLFIFIRYTYKPWDNPYSLMDFGIESGKLCKFVVHQRTLWKFQRWYLFIGDKMSRLDWLLWNCNFLRFEAGKLFSRQIDSSRNKQKLLIKKSS